jgi:uncharacterized cupin superfamily protein
MDAYSIVRSPDAFWAESGPMNLMNADLGDQVGATRLAVRLMRLPPGRAATKHTRATEEELYVLLAGEGELRVGDEVVQVDAPLDVVLVRPGAVRQLFNDTAGEVLWLMIASGGREADVTLPDDPRRLPPELGGGLFEPDA